MRTDGYFDTATRNWILQYQQENALAETGEIDLDTAKSIYLTYKTNTQDLTQDTQLQSLISMIENANA